jgi:molecular chaperone GrpE (heat shock protein)
MSRDEQPERQPAEPAADPGDDGAPQARAEPPEFKVFDRRHWQVTGEGVDEAPAEPRSTRPSVVEEYRRRAEAAELRLQEYIEAFKRHEQEQESFRTRIARDVDRRVELRFGELVGELLHLLDDLELSLGHVQAVPAARPLAEGVSLARNRFLATLARQGVEKILPDGQPFDPNEAEALRVEPVDTPDREGIVVETLQPGYRLGGRILRPARVAVGRYTPASVGGDAR